jgi:beta-glucosidase
LKAPESRVLIDAARSADAVLFFVVDNKHGEQYDMSDLELPGGQAQAIVEIAAANPHVAVVLLTGGPVSLEPWADQVPAILTAWYAGQSTGDAVADVLLGTVAPAGKLSCTFGKRLEDYACHALGLWPPRLLLDKDPGSPGMTPEERRPLCAYAADYKEGVFMGYRWFDQQQIEPRFPFGHGLSYTTFAYDDIRMTESAEAVRVGCTVKNTGDRPGDEVVQLYVANAKSSVPRPPRELKGFAKVRLQPGESRQVEIVLPPSALAYYDAPAKQWKAEAGDYGIELGSSSRDIRLRAKLKLAADRRFDRL